MNIFLILLFFNIGTVIGYFIGSKYLKKYSKPIDYLVLFLLGFIVTPISIVRYIIDKRKEDKRFPNYGTKRKKWLK